MPDLKKIPTHNEWSSFKKQHKQDRLSVSGVDVGSSFDAYHAAVKPGLKNIAGSVAAAHTLQESMSKYLGKLPKDAKRPKAFDDGVTAIRDAAKHNFDALTAQQHEVAQFSQTLQRFHGEILRLTSSPGFNTLEEIKKDQLLPPLIEAARKLDIHDHISDEVVAFRRSRDHINSMAAMKNGPGALGEVPELRIHAQKILQNLQAALNA